jgi:hypothetical protein
MINNLQWKGKSFHYDPNVSDCGFESLLEFPDALFHGVDVESILGKVDVWSLQDIVTVRNGHSFWSDRWIAIKLLLEFSNALFYGVDVGSILGEVDVWSHRARVTVRKCHNFWSDRWIAIKLLLEFLHALFHGVDVEFVSGFAIHTRWGGSLVVPG